MERRLTEAILNHWIQRIEAASGDLPGLETIKDELVAAPGLDDREREALLGRTATYLGDLEGGNQVWWGDATPPPDAGSVDAEGADVRDSENPAPRT